MPKETAVNGKMPVAASIYPLAFLAEQVGGDFVSVTQITPGGIEPHDYDPSPRKIALVYDAKIFLMNGSGVDPWAGNLYTDLQSKKITVWNASQHLDLLALPGIKSWTEKDMMQPDVEKRYPYGISDPHFWLDPLEFERAARAITEEFKIADAPVLDSPRQNAYEQNFQRLSASLRRLDSEYVSGLKNCALNKVIVSHDAFRYLAKHYNFETIAISGISPDEDPSPKHLADLADLAKKNGIKYIFFETLVSPKLAETIASEIGAKTLVLNPIEGLTAEDIRNGKNYISLMEENLQNLRAALQCQ
jgi:zinc transport system substrate-binding protein